MKFFIRTISVFSVVLMCLGLLGIPAFAAPFSCNMMLSAQLSEENVVVSVTTDQAAGAVSGKLTFDNELLSFDPERTVCYESTMEAKDVCTVIGNTITFTVVADDLTNGAIQWIDFAFTVKGNGKATFSVSEALASDVNENLSQNIAVSPVSIYVGDRITAWNLTLGDHIGANFCVYADDVDNTQVRFTTAGVSSLVNVSDAKTEGEGFYVFSTNLAAAQMTDSIAVEVLVNGEVVDSSSYTIRQYADVILNGNYTAKEKTLVQAMLNYGGKAQLYFDYNKESLANANISVAEADIPTNADSSSVSGKVNGLKFYGSTLVFQSKTTLRFYFTGDVTGCSFKTEDKTLTPVEKDGMWYVEVAGINPQELDQPVTITVNDSLTVTYSPLNYIVRMNAKGSENLVALLKALYTYHLAAVAYTR